MRRAPWLPCCPQPEPGHLTQRSLRSVFVADRDGWDVAKVVTAVGHDEDLAVGQDRMDPGVDDLVHPHDQPGLLGDLALHALLWRLARFEPATWEFPLVTLVA